MAIKNYTSDKPLEKIFAELQQTLAGHGAKQISYEYGDDGKVHGVEFAVTVHDHRIRVKLPLHMGVAKAPLYNTIARRNING